MLESFSGKAFEYKRLSEDEQKKRGILGRLVGVIADTKAPTRNDRFYTRELWEKVFEDPIMQEKITNRCCFGELGHPADRDEVDMEKVAICLAEKPKISDDGNLYGVFDILSTANGKILKALCDYGCKIGISSRGSGDLYTDADGNEAVEPDTYECECFDAVIIPAVKSARLNYVTESLDKKASGLRKALRESYSMASDSDKKIMDKTFAELDLDVIPDSKDVSKEPCAESCSKSEKTFNLDDIPESLAEAMDEEEVNNKETEASTETEITEVEVFDDNEELNTVKDLKEILTNLVSDLDAFKDSGLVEVCTPDKNVVIDTITFDKSANNGIKINIGYNTVTGEEDKKDSNLEASSKVDLETIDTNKEAKDNGSDEVINSITELVKERDNLQQTLEQLKADRAVGDTKVKQLTEQVKKYKDAFIRTSDVAAKANKLGGEVKALKEALAESNNKLSNITKNDNTKTINVNKLTESVKQKTEKINLLSENLEQARVDFERKETALSEQITSLKKALAAKTQVVEQYKSRYNETLNSYIKSKASMLGVSTNAIICKLDENYSIDNIDAVCDKLLSNDVSYNNLPINITQKSRVKFAENKQKKSSLDPNEGYEIDDSLLELAGLI